jgi:hypothetical protein
VANGAGIIDVPLSALGSVDHVNVVWVKGPEAGVRLRRERLADGDSLLAHECGEACGGDDTGWNGSGVFGHANGVCWRERCALLAGDAAMHQGGKVGELQLGDWKLELA